MDGQVRICAFQFAFTLCIFKECFTSAIKSESIRLVNGSALSNGRLEVRLNKSRSWGTVCDHGFTQSDAKVACKELRLPIRHVEIKSNAYYGRGSGSILMSNLRCSGNEMSLRLCPKTEYPTSCCHSEDVGISCLNDCPSFTFGVQCDRSCVCDQSKSLSCDKDTGECLCKNGWTGVKCTCGEKTECDENSFCDDNKCFCNDGVLNKPSNCSDEVFVLYSCSFETDIETCSIFNHGEMKWRKHSHGTPSDNTGPYSAKQGTFYVYTEATGLSTGDEGVMEIALANLTITTTACFQFYFHMRGSDMGDLDVIVEDKSGSEIVRWTKSEHVDSEWNRGFVSFPTNAEMIKVTGRRGNGFRSDIALDDFKIYQEQCKCPLFKFGTNCNKTCVCDQSKSLSCDKDTGECFCKNGWTGVKCSCREKTECDENSFCEGSNCVCNDGVLNKPSNCSDEVFVLYSCSFETDIETCSIHNHGEMKWRKHSHGTPSDNTGPYSAKEGTFYVYTEASGLSTGDEGVMEISLANLNLTTNACFQFYFRMRGNDMGDLDVIVEDKSGSEIVRWSKSGHVDAGWNQGFVSLPVNAEMINVTGRRGSDFTSDIALDGFKIYKEHCNCPPFTFGAQCDKSCACDQSKSLSCDKDTGECLCKNGWAGVKCTCGEKTECDGNSFCDANNCLCNDGVFNKPTNCSDEDFVLYSCSFETYIKACSIEFHGKMKWRKHSHGTPSDETGPYSAKEGTFYVYTEASGGSAGDEGVMEISLANLNLTTYACFQFYFHMRGNDMGNLDVIINDKSGSEIARWSKSGHVDSEWKQGFVSFPANAEFIKVTGRRGSGFTSDIALDDLKIFQGHCSCESWTFGLVCEKVCDCRRGSSTNCDSKSGTCMCKQGWSGKTCNCRISLDNCHSAYSYCHGYRCLCKDGQYRNGVNCSGLIDVTYFCGFDMFDSLERCNIELLPMQWEIIEDLEQNIDNVFHLENNRYLKTRESWESLLSSNSSLLFSVQNVSVGLESCLQVKYFIHDQENQRLRIKVEKEKYQLIDRLFQGKDWSTARITLNAMSNMKIHFIIGNLYSNTSIMIDDIIITRKACGYLETRFEDLEKHDRTIGEKTILVIIVIYSSVLVLTWFIMAICVIFKSRRGKNTTDAQDIQLEAQNMIQRTDAEEIYTSLDCPDQETYYEEMKTS